MWEIGVLLLLVAVLAVLLAQRFIPRGPRGELVGGTLLGPTVNEHAVYQRMAVNVDAWPMVGQPLSVVYSPKNLDNWKFAPPEPPEPPAG